MRARTIAIIIISLTAAAIAGVLGWRLWSARVNNSPHVKVDRSVYPVRGIDVSAHNGVIDFSRVAADSVEFVYVKATEGATWRDALFEQNYSAASDAGLRVGAYHYFRFDVPGWRQSVNIINTIGRRHLDLPIAIDVEEWGNATEFTTREVVDNLRSLIEILRQNGREPIIYTNKDGHQRFIRGRFDDVALWICSFSPNPTRDAGAWRLWQHSHVGRVAGIRGPVDLCTYNSPSCESFDSWLQTNPAITSGKVLNNTNTVTNQLRGTSN